ncbi:RdgB/HAM1 family non-canonical purine NTP pyrophosphatase [Eupransor demetentiae]|uniref:dITP/XTP pyrophosphatase n=1 Tax=Eupransor demetentiae TaxID=3109584 RepID=A0ABM9N4Y9_9LACO|nr:Inosine/xanthosine triphosphate pyrophosphatase [Lactobacillaceae bacterium LMG 33000]
MTRLIIASKNAGKVSEIEKILGTILPGWQFLSLKDLHQEIEIVEDGQTFEENALKKAETIQKCYPDDFVLADDSGLSVAALNGEPGVYSARYAGDHDDAANRAKVLAKLAGQSQRDAAFVTVMTLVGPGRQPLVSKGELKGTIASAERGSNGFGYDSIFQAEGSSETLAQYSADQKNAISHRSRALQALVKAMPAWLKED